MCGCVRQRHGYLSATDLPNNADLTYTVGGAPHLTAQGSTNPNTISAFPSWKSQVFICRASTKPSSGYTNKAGMRWTHWRFVQLLKCSAQSLLWDSNLWPWQCYCLALPTEALQSILIKAHVSKTEYSHPHGNTDVKAAAKREVFLNIKVILFVSLLLFSGSLAFKKLIMAPAELSAAWLSGASRKAK